MRILHALPNLSGGGAERQLGYLAEAQARAGHEVSVAYLVPGPEGVSERFARVDLHALPASGNYDPRLLARLVSLVRRLRPDVVHTWILQMDVLAGAAARLTGTPWVCREPVSGGAYGGAWKHRLRERLLRGADAIVANSRAGERHWAERGTRASLATIPNALDLEAIEKAAPRRPEVLRDGPFALAASRLENQQKNVSGLLAGLRLALEAQAVEAVVCGEGPYRAQAEAFVAGAGLSGRIHLPGFARDLWSYMKAAGVFVSVSYLEGQPNTVMEAMACGCPLVVSDIPVHREFLDEESALFVDPDDAAAIARAVTRCLAEPEAARARAEEARRRAANWSVAEMARRYERVYDACLARRRR